LMALFNQVELFWRIIRDFRDKPVRGTVRRFRDRQICNRQTITRSRADSAMSTLAPSLPRGRGGLQCSASGRRICSSAEGSMQPGFRMPRRFPLNLGGG